MDWIFTPNASDLWLAESVTGPMRTRTLSSEQTGHMLYEAHCNKSECSTDTRLINRLIRWRRQATTWPKRLSYGCLAYKEAKDDLSRKWCYEEELSTWKIKWQFHFQFQEKTKTWNVTPNLSESSPLFNFRVENARTKQQCCSPCTRKNFLMST